MVDKKFLKDKNLLEAHEQFMRLCEWSYVPQTLDEEGDDEQDDLNQQNSQSDNMSNDTNNNADNGIPSDSNMNSIDNNMDMNNNDGINQTNAENDEMGLTSNNMVNNEPTQQFDNDMMDDNMDNEEVIDVDDITNAQEKMNTKVNHVGKELGTVDDKIESLLSSLEKMEQMIDNNNKEIANFKQEFEKRNPTQTEKLNLRSLDSYPFNVNPKEYWKNKENEYGSNYSGYGDNTEPTTKEYEITNNDIDDFNEREIDKSFDIDDDWKQDFSKIFGI